MDSDADSDFYGILILLPLTLGYKTRVDFPSGDKETAADLQSRVDSFDVGGYWEERAYLGMAMPQKQTTPQPAPATLHNPYEGWPDAVCISSAERLRICAMKGH